MNEEMRICTSEMDEARAFFGGVFDSVPVSIVVLDENPAIVSWSRGAQDMWGLLAEEVTGRPFFSVDFGLPTATLRETVRSCLLTKERSDLVQLHAINRLGQGIDCSVPATPLDGSGGGGVVLLIQETGGDGGRPQRGAEGK